MLLTIPYDSSFEEGFFCLLNQTTPSTMAALLSLLLPTILCSDWERISTTA
jgi:hypothetical protein